MEKLTLSKLKRDYGVDKKTAAAFMLMLFRLDPGDELNSSIGTILKTDESTFRLSIDQATIRMVLEESDINGPEYTLGKIFSDKPG